MTTYAIGLMVVILALCVSGAAMTWALLQVGQAHDAARGLEAEDEESPWK